ncbi:MAG: hypothetical protein ACREOZ_04010, partial [Gloeomargaritales cyanobacterium]
MDNDVNPPRESNHAPPSYSAPPLRFNVASDKKFDMQDESAIVTIVNVSWHVCKESRICNPRDKIAALFAELQNHGDKNLELLPWKDGG